MSDLPYPTYVLQHTTDIGWIATFGSTVSRINRLGVFSTNPKRPYVAEAYVKAPNIARSRLRAAP